MKIINRAWRWPYELKIIASRFMKIINRAWRWSYELKIIAFKNQKALRFSKMKI